MVLPFQLFESGLMGNVCIGYGNQSFYNGKITKNSIEIVVDEAGRKHKRRTASSNLDFGREHDTNGEFPRLTIENHNYQTSIIG